MNTTPEADRADLFGGSEILLTQLDPPLRANLRRTLNRAGYRTVEEVVEATDAELLALRGIGKFSVRILREALDHRIVRHRLNHVPLEALRHELPARIVSLLKREDFDTAEEVALITNAELLDIRMLGAPSLLIIRHATSSVLAENYTSRKPVRFTAAQVREIVAVLAELVPYADQEHNTNVGHRARALLDTLAPGFPNPETSRAHPIPNTADNTRRPVLVPAKDDIAVDQHHSTAPADDLGLSHGPRKGPAAS